MKESLFTTVPHVYRDSGAKAVAALTLKRLIRPVATLGSLYFLERDLNIPMPPLQPINGIVVREGTLADLPLLDPMKCAERQKQQAVDRLKQGDHWFIGIEEATGKLT